MSAVEVTWLNLFICHFKPYTLYFIFFLRVGYVSDVKSVTEEI